MRGGHGHGHRCRPSEPDPVDRLRDPDPGTAAAPELPRRHLPHPGRVARPRHHPLTRRCHDPLFGSSDGSSGARGSSLSSIPLASRPQRVTSVTRSSVALRRWLNSRTSALKKARPAGGFWPTTAVRVSRSSTSNSVAASACTVAERWSPPNRFISPKNSPGPMRVSTLSTLCATALEMTSWPESTKYISSPTSPSRKSVWPACTARQVIRDASVSISGPLNARKISSVRRSEEHTSELQSRRDLVCRLLLEKKKKTINKHRKRKKEKGNKPQ